MRSLVLSSVLLLGAIVGRAAWADEAKPFPAITVSGQGQVQVAPDQAMVTVGVATEAKTAAEALKANTERMTELLSVLKDHEIAEKHIQTSNFSVSPQHIYDRNGQPPKLVGYTVTNQVTVRVLEVARLGTILDAVVTAGGNQIQGVKFSVGDSRPRLDQARRKAVRDAVARATLFAEAAGVQLGRPIKIVEQGISPPRPMAAQAMRSMEAAAVPIAAGEHTIEAQVTVTFGIAE